VKGLAHEMPPLYVAWGRSIAGVLVIAPCLLWQGGVAGMRTNALRLHCFRGLFYTGGNSLWYEAVTWLPLATVAALGFMGPIFVVLGAAIFLHETVRRHRWIAVGIVFLGMLVIVRPGLVEPSPGIVLMLVAVPLLAGANLVAKAAVGRDKPAVVVLWQSIIGAIFFAPLGLWFWQTPTLPQVGLFLVAGFFGTLGYFCIIWAYRLLDISALQPITFVAIVWAALMDIAVWGKTADVWTFVGAVIIVGATTYVAYRETRKRDPG
jgi:drug/metabolite transporter (DMT)-like permease